MTPPDRQWGPTSDGRRTDPSYPAQAPFNTDTRAPGRGNPLARAARDVARDVAFFFLIPIIVGLLVILISLGVYYRNQIAQQYETLHDFCILEVHQDYVSAPEFLSGRYLGQVTPNMFIQANQQRDQRLGPIQSCAVAARDNLLISFTNAAFTLKVTIRGVSYKGTVTLVNESQVRWVIDTIDPGLHLDTP